MFKRIFFFLFIFPLITFAQSDSVFTYQKVVEAALKNNFDIQIATNNLTIAQTQNTYGNAGFLPRVDLNASMNGASYNTKQEFSSGLTVDKNGVASNTINSGVYLTWTVFDGLKMFATKEKLEQLEQEGQLNLKIQIENTLEAVTLAYYQIVKQQQLIKGIEAAKAVSEERIKIAEKKSAIGSGSNVELLQAKLDLNEQRSALLTEKTSLNEYKSNLLSLLKTDPFTNITADSTFTFEDVKSVDDIKKSIEKANNSILLANKEVLVSNQYIKELRSQALPKLALNANYIFSRNENAAGFTLLNQNLGTNVGFTFSWNLFNGLNTSHQMKVAELQLENNSLDAENLKYMLFSNASASYFKLLGDKEMVTLEEENIKLAEESLKITTERLKLGLGNYIETKESQRSYEDAITRLVNARYNLKVSETALKKLTGELVK